MSFVISIIMIGIVAWGLYRKYNPQGILLLAGVAMLAIAAACGWSSIVPSKLTGNPCFDIVKVVEETFVSNIARAGLMIMIIGGYVAFMNHIKATDALVYLSMKPLARFKRYPYLAASITIPIGQLLFITTPSATGLGLLLVASVYPVLVSLGVSRLTALSVIAASTLFDQGPGSANTAMAAELVGITNVEYFIRYQLPLVLPTSFIIMLLFYFSNRYFDKKESHKIENSNIEALTASVECPDVPLYFAALPVLPLVMLVVCSPYVGLIRPAITINTSTAMLVSLLVSFLLVACHKRNLNVVFQSLSSFFKGMGNVFASVVTLIVASEVFSKGLISLGFIDSLVATSDVFGLSGVTIAVVFALIIFSAAVLMGSGNAAFFSFGPLLPNIATQLSLPAVMLVLPLQLAASMGRAASPIAGIIVAIAGVAGVSPVDLAKRNALPLVAGILFLITYHFLSF